MTEKENPAIKVSDANISGNTNSQSALGGNVVGNGNVGGNIQFSTWVEIRDHVVRVEGSEMSGSAGPDVSIALRISGGSIYHVTGVVFNGPLVVT